MRAAELLRHKSSRAAGQIADRPITPLPRGLCHRGFRTVSVRQLYCSDKDASRRPTAAPK